MKTSRASSSSGVCARTRGTKNAYPLNLLPSTRGLMSMNDAQKWKYESLSVMMTSEQKFSHVESLQTLGICDDMRTLLENLGLLHFVDRKCVTHYRLILEFLSSVRVEWSGYYRGEIVNISFRMFNIDHHMSLKGFNNLLHLPNFLGSFCDVPQCWRPDLFWLSITCAKRKTHINQFWRPQLYDPRQAKATDIWNLTVWYLQCLMANIIFGRNYSQNVYQKGELFLLWCALSGTHVDIGAFILRHLTEVTKTTMRKS